MSKNYNVKISGYITRENKKIFYENKNKHEVSKIICE
jgi:ribosomal protein S17E